MNTDSRSAAHLTDLQEESATPPIHSDRLLSKPIVKMLTGQENTGLHELQNPKSVYYDPTFPKPRRRGPEFPPFWLESEIQAWIRNFGNNPAVNKKPKNVARLLQKVAAGLDG